MMFDLKMFSNSECIVCTKSLAYDALLKHSHNFYELTFVVSGKGIHTIGEKSTKIEKGALYFIANDDEHSVSPIAGDENLSMINIIFAKDCIHYFDFIMSENYFVDTVPETEYIEKLFLKAYSEYKKKQYGYMEILKNIVEQILMHINRWKTEGQYTLEQNKAIKENEKKLREDEVIDYATKYIKENFKKNITVNEIAAEIGCGISTIQKVFKKNKNTTLKKAIIKLRITNACWLLQNTEQTIQEISESIGFNDLKNFYTTFKNIMGITPNEYRVKIKSNQLKEKEG